MKRNDWDGRTVPAVRISHTKSGTDGVDQKFGFNKIPGFSAFQANLAQHKIAEESTNPNLRGTDCKT
jgi:hypothetical protein